jgi:hypothetical protein
VCNISPDQGEGVDDAYRHSVSLERGILLFVWRLGYVHSTDGKLNLFEKLSTLSLQLGKLNLFEKLSTLSLQLERGGRPFTFSVLISGLEAFFPAESCTKQ